MYKYEEISVNISKHMLTSLVPKVKNKLHIILHFKNSPIHAVEIQNPSLTKTHFYIIKGFQLEVGKEGEKRGIRRSIQWVMKLIIATKKKMFTQSYAKKEKAGK